MGDQELFNPKFAICNIPYARELGVATVLAGSVQRAGDRVRVTTMCAADEAKRAVADYKDDVLSYPFAQQWLAVVEAHFGDLDSAMAILPHLLEVPGGLTRGQLRLDPMFDPLRNDPRFQKLAQSEAPETADK